MKIVLLLILALKRQNYLTFLFQKQQKKDGSCVTHAVTDENIQRIMMIKAKKAINSSGLTLHIRGHKIPALVFKTRACAWFQCDLVFYARCIWEHLSPQTTSTLDSKIPRKEGFSSSLECIWFQLLTFGSHYVFQTTWCTILLDLQDLKHEPPAQI